MSGSEQERTLQAVLQEIAEERARQDEQWGGPDHDDEHSAVGWVAMITKHLGRASGAAMPPNDNQALFRL